MNIHCESCGRENPGTDEGYTGCCNELTCDGDTSYGYRFGTRENYVRACCWAMAEKQGITEGSRF